MTPEATVIETLLRIPNKEGVDVDFILNAAQRQLDGALTGRDLVPKARQEGVSSYYLARAFVSCLMYRNVKAVIISHDMESTQRLLSRIRYFIEHIRGPKPIVENMSQNLITFPKMNSMIYIGTAGSRKFGRGDTITHLHCSEYAFWPDAPELMKGLLQAVPMTGQISIESTGNGYNDYYHRCLRAYEGKSIWTAHFLPWHTFPEYTLTIDDPADEALVLRTLREEWEEPAIAKMGLSAGQIAWRRMKLDELNYDLAAFKQEYPMTLDECFQMSSESVFHQVRFEATDAWQKEAMGLWILKGHPSIYQHYVLGADVGAGVGKDSSVVEIFSLEEGRQVAEYTTDRLDPEVFADRIAELGHRFGDAYSVVEANNHGILTLARLRRIYPSQRIHADAATRATSDEKRLHRLGFRTTNRNKPLMIGHLRTLVANEWVIHSPLLKMQLSTFIEHENGKMSAQDGCDDDCVMAAACAAVGLNRAAMIAKPDKPVAGDPALNPFTLDAIMKELHAKGQGWPVKPQTGWLN